MEQDTFDRIAGVLIRVVACTCLAFTANWALALLHDRWANPVRP